MKGGNEVSEAIGITHSPKANRRLSHALVREVRKVMKGGNEFNERR